MGLIKAAFAATGGTLADQWKEFFYCDALDSDVLAAKGKEEDLIALFQYQRRR